MRRRLTSERSPDHQVSARMCTHRLALKRSRRPYLRQQAVARSGRRPGVSGQTGTRARHGALLSKERSEAPTSRPRGCVSRALWRVITWRVIHIRGNARNSHQTEWRPKGQGWERRLAPKGHEDTLGVTNAPQHDRYSGGVNTFICHN